MSFDAVNDNDLYNISHWGEGYFSINPQGNIEVSTNSTSKGVELQKIVNAAGRAGLQLPLLIRFTDILQDRVSRLYEAFYKAIVETEYKGKYKLVYPIKVNQQQSVLRELMRAPEHTIGLEAGSKPELMAVIGLLGQKQSTIICNGYKDSSYIRTALIAQQMGHEVFIVIEKHSELQTLLQEAEKLAVQPKIGIRVRLITKSAGKWENTGGVKSKFGLNAAQVLDVVEQLKERNSLHYLQLMHCHLGSQIANIQDLRQCMQEVARYYVELRCLGAPISTIDVGGGLAVDYEGTHSNTDCSMNYSIHEYATHILLALRYLCQETDMPEPDIISESGRALTAHHAVLITNITDLEAVKKTRELPRIEPDDSHVIHEIWDTYQALAESPASEIYHYATHSLTEAYSMFKHGLLHLKEKAKVEQLYTNICLEIQQKLDESNPGDNELIAAINERLATKIFCNLSFFQSIPDAWAIGQIFPVLPISQLTPNPEMHAILQDLTCDSDGTIKQYTGNTVYNNTLRLPVYDENKPYHLGFFLVGAYQEILGNLHNLFGDTNSMDVKLKGGDDFEITDLISGDTITNVLSFANYDSKRLLQSYEKQLLNADLPNDKIQFYLNELRSIFTQQTYFDSKQNKGYL
ncbi:biosynthetic arginine decarboxylase [Legionella israelensis]|uniref:Arginine decarboxylase n=1 Tax=Legionella israelensis TaxID=454 RepID=A0A0W0VUK1_9GAMM|nr:biosynthetic arginine decarboxylase [Legionella israelensis]KTD23711.1 arginine decarboxylase [Legionella israelensis]QBS10909.1 biosynthetic arginine decarboxylase [Legionella israelensis]SCX80078.1 arginine decarboxylase [Legionella israelensis DSM 19235]STX57897.1 arginine decarboxylase [Legionella israelensis]